MGGPVNRRIILKARPIGIPRLSDFGEERAEIPELGDGQVLLRNIYLSLDPAIRGWMSPQEDSYQPPIPIDEVMRGVTVARVEKTNNADFQVGDHVMGLNGWEQWSVSEGRGFINKIPSEMGLPMSNFLSVLGTTGMTAYFGLLDVGKPVSGETVLVSAAAGAVGSLVGQIAKNQGCRAVGIAGGKEKCKRLIDFYGFDAAIDYKAPGDLEEKISANCPNGIDIYFDNVGGDMLDAALNCLGEGARVVMCGAIATYNDDQPRSGPSNLWQLLVHNARLEGFIVSKYIGRFSEGLEKMGQWLGSGLIKHREEIVVGLENAPSAFLKLFDGSNKGKLIIDLSGA